MSKIWKFWVSVFWDPRVVRGGLPSRNAAGDISPGDISDLQKCIARPSPPTLEPSEEETDYCAARPASFGALSRTGPEVLPEEDLAIVGTYRGNYADILHCGRDHATGGNVSKIKAAPVTLPLLWRRSATWKRQSNKGGPCHVAPTAENHAAGGNVSQIKAAPVTL